MLLVLGTTDRKFNVGSRESQLNLCHCHTRLNNSAFSLSFTWKASGEAGRKLDLTSPQAPQSTCKHCVRSSVLEDGGKQVTR